MSENEKTLLKIIEAIGKRIDSIEDNLMWMIRADQRGFSVGHNNEFAVNAVKKLQKARKEYLAAYGKRGDLLEGGVTVEFEESK